MHPALPAMLVVGDTHTYIMTGYEGGNPVAAQEVGGNMPLVAVDLGGQPKSVKCGPQFEVAVCAISHNENNFKRRMLVQISGHVLGKRT